MKEIFFRFITIHPMNDHPILGWALGVIWLVMVANCVASIRQQPIEIRSRLMWMLIVALVPIFGMAAYLGYCLLKADYSFLKFILGPPKHIRGLAESNLKLPTKQ
jgi:apolipoprotein N-acyltransferase